MKTYLLFFVFAASVHLAPAQDSLVMNTRKNTLKLDLTHNLIYRDAFNLSWERIIKKNQTLGFTIGYQEFPKVLNLGENIEAEREYKSNGYKFGTEYRFYLQKENKFSAPRGVYIGPYFTVLGFNTSRGIVYNGGETPERASYTSKFHLYSLGAQLGYQFVFNDRWSLDLVLIGPSITRYDASLRMDGDFEFDPEDVQNEILDALIDKFPGLEDLLEDKELNSSGNVDVLGIGYRYQFLIGYRFGKKFKKN
jgi:opacity protein-like surface antigen